ncbi:MAG: exodeoxyribonuclease VII small subunit [Micrococcaceae bacterium]
MTETSTDIENLSYEEAREQLVNVVAQLESGQVSLEDSVKLWERGVLLAKRCNQWLEGVKAKVDAAMESKQ